MPHLLGFCIGLDSGELVHLHSRCFYSFQFALLFCVALAGLELRDPMIPSVSRVTGSKACIATTPYHTTPQHSGFSLFFFFKLGSWDKIQSFVFLWQTLYLLSYFLLHPVLHRFDLIFRIKLWIRFTYITVLILWLKRMKPSDNLDKFFQDSVVSSWALVWTQSPKHSHCAVSEN